MSRKSFFPCCSCAMSGSIQSSTLRKFARAFSYILDTPQQHASLVSYTRYNLPPKYKYERPGLLDLDEEGTNASADHDIRPVMHTRRPLLMNAGYAEAINAGKTQHINEDQSSFCSFVVTVPEHLRDPGWKKETCQIPVIYFGMFDGHAGTGAALFAYHKLHLHVKDRLTQISHMLIMPQSEIDRRYLSTGLVTSIDAEKLIIGALEEAFQAMDDEIKQERYDHHIDGGCTAVAAIFIKGKLYVAGAGDSRAVLYKDEKPIPMSRDHCPESERRRIQLLAYCKPTLLHDEYTRFQFQHRCRKKDVGTRQLYRDHEMDGWGFKVIDRNDLKPQLICGEGKRARLLDTIGTTRGFGDHDLEVPYAVGVKIKPFMTPAPEVFVYDLQKETFNSDDVLVIATDGLWEKLSNEKVGELLMSKIQMQKSDEPRRYIVGAQSLVDEARGSLGERGWRMLNNDVATYDDVSVFVIPLNEWLRSLELVLDHHRNPANFRTNGHRYSVRSSSADEFFEISSLATVGDQLTADQMNDVTKSYENIKNVNIPISHHPKSVENKMNGTGGGTTLTQNDGDKEKDSLVICSSDLSSSDTTELKEM